MTKSRGMLKVELYINEPADARCYKFALAQFRSQLMSREREKWGFMRARRRWRLRVCRRTVSVGQRVQFSTLQTTSCLSCRLVVIRPLSTVSLHRPAPIQLDSVNCTCTCTVLYSYCTRTVNLLLVVVVRSHVHLRPRTDGNCVNWTLHQCQ